MSYTSDYTSNEPTRAEVDGLGGDTLLEFGAEWCLHCQAVQGDLKRLLPATVRHLKVEDGKGRRLGRSYAVKLWPNLVLLRNGQVLQQLARPTAAEMEAALQTFSSSE